MQCDRPGRRWCCDEHARLRRDDENETTRDANIERECEGIERGAVTNAQRRGLRDTHFSPRLRHGEITCFMSVSCQFHHFPAHRQRQLRLLRKVGGGGGGGGLGAGASTNGSLGQDGWSDAVCVCTHSLWSRWKAE